MLSRVGGANPPLSAFPKKKPFDEHVEGLSHCGTHLRHRMIARCGEQQVEVLRGKEGCTQQCRHFAIGMWAICAVSGWRAWTGILYHALRQRSLPALHRGGTYWVFAHTREPAMFDLRLMRVMVLIFPATALLCSEGCCLKSVTLTPEFKGIDIAKAAAASAQAEFRMEFDECCPSCQQKELALQLQQKVLDSFKQLVDGTMELSRYNQLSVAAQDTLNNVILVCKAQNGNKEARLAASKLLDPSGTKAADAINWDAELAKAWARVANLVAE